MLFWNAPAVVGKSAEAEKNLKVSIAKAAKLNFIGYALIARLQLDAIEVKGGQTSAGRFDAESLERDAKAKNFSLIARKATALNSTYHRQ